MFKKLFTLLICVGVINLVPINAVNALAAGDLLDSISASGETTANEDMCNWPTGTNQPSAGGSGYAARVVSGTNTIINKIALQAENPSGNTGDVQAAIYADNGGNLSSTLLATFAYSGLGATLGNSQQVVEFTGSFSVVPGQAYWVAVSKTGARLAFCGGTRAPEYGTNWSYGMNGAEYRNAVFPSSFNYNFPWPKHLNMRLTGVTTTLAAPWYVSASQTQGGSVTSRTATQIAGPDNYVELTTDQESLASNGVIKVTGSKIIYENAFAGTLNAAATEIVWSQATDGGDKFRVATPTTGTITVQWFSRSVLNGVPTDTLAQTITITVSAVKTWSDRYSTATAAGSGAAGVAGTGETILAPKGALNAAAVNVGTVTMSFKDSTNVNLSVPTGEFPSVRATITGPGNIGFNGEAAVGRDVSLVTKAQAPVLNIFNDGTGGTSTITIFVGGVQFATKTVRFYGTVTTLTATQGLFVAPIAGGQWGCGTATATCAAAEGAIAKIPAAVVAATDANNIPVPFLTIGGSSSDTTVFSSSVVQAETVATGTGSYNVAVTALPAGTSGKTSAITFRTLLADGVTYVSAAPVTYAIGGAAASIAFTVNASGNAGAKGTFTIDKKDSAGNKSVDAAHTVLFRSNTAVTASIFDASSNTQSGATSTQTILNGTKTWDFFNPLVDAAVTFDVTVDSLLTGSQSFTVTTVSQAALDASQEAIDAANAATDAANAAAEAADAATAAAQDAADAVAALSTQVSEMIAALRKQITALTNLVIKIQKKVKA